MSPPRPATKDTVCHKCGKTGHLAKVCRSKSNPPPKSSKAKKGSTRPVRQVDEESDKESDEESNEQLLPDDRPIQMISVVKQGGVRQPPIKVQVGVDECVVTMEVDTGASMTIMSETCYHKLWPGRSLSPSSVRLQNYSKEPIPVVGMTTCQVCYEGQTAGLPLIIVKGNGPTLFGRNWLKSIGARFVLYVTVLMLPYKICCPSMSRCSRMALGSTRDSKHISKSTLPPLLGSVHYPIRSVWVSRRNSLGSNLGAGGVLRLGHPNRSRPEKR